MARWYYHPDSTKLLPIDRTVARRIFNDAVRGDLVREKTSKNQYSIQLPPQNSAFKEFAKICPQTNGGDIDMSIFDYVSNAVKIEH